MRCASTQFHTRPTLEKRLRIYRIALPTQYMLDSDTLLLENQHAHEKSRTRCQQTLSGELQSEWKWAYDTANHTNTSTRAGGRTFFLLSQNERSTQYKYVYYIVWKNELRTSRRPREMQSISIWMRLHRTFLPKERFFFCAVEMFRNPMDDKFQWHTICLINTFHCGILFKTFPYLCGRVGHRCRRLSIIHVCFRTSRWQWETLQHHCLSHWGQYVQVPYLG